MAPAQLASRYHAKSFLRDAADVIAVLDTASVCSYTGTAYILDDPLDQFLRD